MNYFWHDGYEATAVRDLAIRMGITGTNHCAFGGKRERCDRLLVSSTGYIEGKRMRRVTPL